MTKEPSLGTPGLKRRHGHLRVVAASAAMGLLAAAVAVAATTPWSHDHVQLDSLHASGGAGHQQRAAAGQPLPNISERWLAWLDSQRLGVYAPPPRGTEPSVTAAAALSSALAAQPWRGATPVAESLLDENDVPGEAPKLYWVVAVAPPGPEYPVSGGPVPVAGVTSEATPRPQNYLLDAVNARTGVWAWATSGTAPADVFPIPASSDP